MRHKPALAGVLVIFIPPRQTSHLPVELAHQSHSSQVSLSVLPINVQLVAWIQNWRSVDDVLFLFFEDGQVLGVVEDVDVVLGELVQSTVLDNSLQGRQHTELAPDKVIAFDYIFSFAIVTESHVVQVAQVFCNAAGSLDSLVE